MADAAQVCNSGITLYSYWRSSCSWRVRIALALKGLTYEYKAVLAGENLTAEYTALNPMQQVPSLVTEDGVFADSIAILEYLEEKFPQRPLLPTDLKTRASIRQAVHLIASNIQPLQNARVTEMIGEKLGSEEESRWGHYFITRGFTALEQVLKRTSGKYSFGDEVTLADVVLVPQVANAYRFSVDMTRFPTLDKIYYELNKLDLVKMGSPENQPDAIIA